MAKQKVGLLNAIKITGFVLLSYLTLTANVNAQVNEGQWSQEEINSFLSSCLHSSQKQGLDDFAAGVYCTCTLIETSKLYPAEAPKLEDWNRDELYKIVDSCVEFTLNHRDVDSSNLEIESLAVTVDYLISQNEYEKAFLLLEDEDQTDPEIRLMLEKTHLNYGLYNMNTFEPGDMRTRMNNALVQFVEVLKINPHNFVAHEQIELIMGVFESIPNRSPDEYVLEMLREIRFDY